MILLSVPVAVMGALLAENLRGFANDVYCQIGLVMLIGLASKNAILIVEFADQLREEGLSTVRAAVQAATDRLRPILMTSFAFILGIYPLVVAEGAGSASRQSLGTAVMGGMLVSTLLSLFIVPICTSQFVHRNYVIARSPLLAPPTPPPNRHRQSPQSRTSQQHP